MHAAWRRSAWENRVGPLIKYADFIAGQAHLQSKLVDRSEVRVVEFDGIDEILGFAAVEGHVLHYVYVKHDFRRQHLAQALAAGCREYSTYSPSGIKLAEALHLQYNPYKVL